MPSRMLWTLRWTVFSVPCAPVTSLPGGLLPEAFAGCARPVIATRSGIAGEYLFDNWHTCALFVVLMGVLTARFRRLRRVA